MSRTPQHILSPTYLSWLDNATPRWVKFDVVESEKHTFTAQITEHPVESGSNIGDHVRHDLDMITLEILISNSPITNESLTWQQERASGFVGPQALPYPPTDPKPFFPTPGAIFGAIGSGIADLLGFGYQRHVNANVLNFPGDAASKDVVFSELRRLKLNAIPVEIITGLDVYEDMLLIGLDVPRTPKEGDAVRMTLNFKNIRKVQSKLVTAPAASIPSAAKPLSKGKQDTTPYPDTAPQKTAALALVNKALGALSGGGFTGPLF